MHLFTKVEHVLGTLCIVGIGEWEPPRRALLVKKRTQFRRSFVSPFLTTHAQTATQITRSGEQL